MTNQTLPFRCIAVDLDGTLLNSSHQLNPGTKAALQRAMAAGVAVIIATGKTRASSGAVVRELNLTTPGVYSQGLIIANPDGTIRHEIHLADELVREATEAGLEHGCSVVIYKDTKIFTTTHDEYTAILDMYHEPTPQPTGSVDALMAHGPFQKLILLQEPDHLDNLFPQLASQFDGRASLVMSQRNMLEVVPLGTSKGAGLKRLLADLDIPFEQTIAFGDGDNDLEMIRWAKIGVAMGNAMPKVKEAADFVTLTNDEDGIAHALYRFVFQEEH